VDIPPGFTFVERKSNPFDEEAKARRMAAGLELLAIGMLG
jgi:hypothetical protein